MTVDPYEITNAFHLAFPDAKKQSGNEYLISCPSPGHEDHNPSCSVNVEKNVFSCFSCGHKGHLAQLEGVKRFLPQPKKTNPSNGSFSQRRMYVYTDVEGNNLLRLVTFKRGDKKGQYFEKFQNGKWERRNKENDGPLPPLLYKLPEVSGAEKVYLVEGEKDADTLGNLGFTATTNPAGAGTWNDGLGEWLRDKDVVILADNDSAGRKRLFRVGHKLRGIARSVGYVPPKYWGGDKSDVTDFLEEHPDRQDELVVLLESPETFPWDLTEPWLDELNKKYATCLYGNKHRVMYWPENIHEPGVIQEGFLSRDDFRAVEVENGDKWLKHPQHSHYQQVIFAPGKKLSGDVYNMWQGFTVDPIEKPELVERFWNHVHENICNRDPNLTSWVRSWCAGMFQDPGVPNGTAIVLRGKQGTGKSIFAEILGSLFGTKHYFHASDNRQFTGNFNSHLMDKVLVFGDESYWGGDKRSEGALKRIITEKTLIIEPKGVNSFTTPNCMHLILASNEEWVVPAGMRDERRFAVFDMGNRHIQDFDYFGAIVEDMKNGGKEALLHDLLTYAIDQDYRKIPMTEGLRTQQELSAPGEIKYLLDVAESGEYLPGYDGDEIPFGPFYDQYLIFLRSEARKNKLEKKLFGKMLRDMFGEPTQKRLAIGDQYYRTRCYKPESFEHFKQKVDELFSAKDK